jgi:hypothetical protein
MDRSELDRAVRLHIYNTLAATSQPPGVTDTASALSASFAAVEASYHRLADNHVIVLQPDRSDVWMAMPFSAVPTPFRVTVGQQSWWANCAWDALGIAAMLGQDAHITSADAHDGKPLDLYVRAGQLLTTPAIAHFAVPAAHWWDDIGYT